MKTIDVSTPKYPGRFAIVDDDDFDRIGAFKWSADSRPGRFYATRSISVNGKQTTIRMHVAVFGSAPPGFEIDHIDGDGLNNQKSNLRQVTTRQNQMNRRSACGASRYKGVFRYPSGRWFARIIDHGARIHLGVFDREVDAAIAYNHAAAERFGEFAALNEVRNG